MTRTGGIVGAVAVALALTAGLAGCSQTAESALAPDDCVPAVSEGDASRAVATPGEFGVSTDATFPVPLRADSIEVTVTGAGTGAPITDHGIFTGSMQVFDGTSGAELLPYAPLREGADGDGAPVTLQSLAAELPGVATSLVCAQAGERVTSVMSASHYLGPQVANQLDVATATIVAVVDVMRVLPSSASGVVLPPQDGMPAVVAAPSGQPGVTMPQQQPPTEQRSALRVQGYGPAVAAGDRLTLHASIFSWETGDELGSSWNTANSVLELAAVAGPADDGLFGATSALIGQQVGSQVIVVVPPEQAEAIAGPLRTPISDYGALVLVVDILAADPPGV